jgi:hypothetical protein
MFINGVHRDQGASGSKRHGQHGWIDFPQATFGKEQVTTIDSNELEDSQTQMQARSGQAAISGAKVFNVESLRPAANQTCRVLDSVFI